ncbi:MAG: hemolysin family protein [Chloroherpetonaceae bacterium]|nr:hemolysin family protein [Chloroherpetonaceae bacterium]
MSELLQLSLIFVAMLSSAFFSGTEIAFITANSIKLEMFERKRLFGSRSAVYFTQNIDKTLTTLLVGNNFANVIISSLMAILLERYFFSQSPITVTTVTALTILFLCEVIPKLGSRALAEYVVLVSAPFLRVVYFTLYPMVRISQGVASSVAQLFGTNSTDVNQFFRKQDLEILIRENATSRGAEGKAETEMFSKALAISEIRVKESMVPRTEIEGIEKGSTMKEVFARFAESGYSRMPVYEESIDKIIGIVTIHDLFTKPKNLEKITKEILFVPETKRSVELLQEFTASGQSIAIVVDEFGGTAGIVTSEDLVEELVGDIQDEFDSDEDVLRALSENTFLISGRVEIDIINERFNLTIPKDDYETLAGYILSKAGKIPQQGEILSIDEFMITIAKANKTKIDMVKLQVLQSRREIKNS